MTKLFRPFLAAALALTGIGLAAQDGKAFDARLKFHAGITGGDIQKDLDKNKVIGIGAEFDFKVGDAVWFGEVLYNKYSSEDYAPPMPANVYVNPTGAGSVELRKYLLDGFSVRAGYRRALFADWNWQAGLTLDMLKNRQEVSLTYRNSGTTILETAAVTPETKKMSPGLFVGLQTTLATDVTLECNLRTLGYDRVNWVTSAAKNFAAPAGVETTKRSGVAVEVAFGFKF